MIGYHDEYMYVGNEHNTLWRSPQGETTLWAGAHKLDRYPFRKMRKSQE